jgi:thioesterase domain-containing protein/acyl carrier protein
VVSVSAPSDDAGFVVPRTELETRLAAIWAEVLKLSQVGINENFFDLGGHSLSAIGLHSQIGKLTGKTLPIASIFQFGTIAQQAQLIEEAVFDQDPIKIIHLRTHGRGRPIFVMPGITGSVMISPRLYELIDSPTFGCQPCLERWNIEMFRDFRVTAGMLADAVKEQQTDGPYALMGYSYGGIMAYEVASVLQQRGEDIAMLAVLDAGPKNRRTRDPIARLTRYSRIARNVPFWLREEGRQFEWRDFSKRLAVFLRHQKRKIIERDFVTKFGDIWDEATISSQNVEIMRTAYDAFRDYEPGYFQGKLTLFRAKTLPLMSGSTKDRGWKRHVRELEIHAFDGDHRSILQSPQIEGLAIKINSLLNQ